MVQRFQDNNIVFDFDTLFAEWPTNDFNIYALSQWDVQILLASLRFADWAVRWVDEEGIPLRETGRFLDLKQAIDEVAKTEWRLKVSLEESLQTGMENISAALINAAEIACACAGANGGGGAGQVADPPNPQDIDNETEPPPEGFDTWEDYKEFKCDVAGFIVDEMSGDVGRMSTLNLIGASLVAAVAGLSPILLTPTPVDDIIIIASIILAAIALGEVVLLNTKSLLDDYRDEFKCAIFLGETVADSIQRFNDAVTQFANDDYPGQPMEYYIGALLSSLANADSFNRLIDPDPSQEYGSENCAACGVGCGTGEWVILKGTVISGDATSYGVPFTVRSETTPGPPAYQRLHMARRNAGDTAYTRVRATFDDLVGWTTYADPLVNLEDTDNCSAINVELFKDESNGAGLNWDDETPKTEECCYFLARGGNSSPFTMVVENIQELP